MKPPRRPAPEPAAPAQRGEDLDFAALMQQQGVTPTARASAGAARKARASHQAATASKSTPRPTASRAPGASTSTSAVSHPASASMPATSHSPGASPAPASQRSAPARGPAVATDAELAARVSALTRERDATIAALKAELAALTAQNLGLTQERDAATLAAANLKREASATEAALRAELNASRAAQRAPEPARSGLAAALRERGLVGPELAAALALLATGESANPLLELLETRDPSALTSLLERRLALVCGDPGCAPEVGAAALQVEPSCCEVCGGSDIQRAAHGFARVCAAAGIVRVRFVGGSPNYRTKLAALFPAGGSLTVHTTLGDKRVRLHRSRSQQRSDDLVIIWGATELDHATSGAYRAEYGRTEVIAHRGIGRMLELAAARIAGAPPGRSLSETGA